MQEGIAHRVVQREGTVRTLTETGQSPCILLVMLCGRQTVTVRGVAVCNTAVRYRMASLVLVGLDLGPNYSRVA
jgi:hypothetical protein